MTRRAVQPATLPPEPAADGFECFLAQQDGGALVVVRGELDMATAPAFSIVLDEAMAASPKVDISMEDVTFLDSGGLRVIAMAVAGVQPGGSITIRNASRPVSRALSVTGLDSRLNFEPASATSSSPPGSRSEWVESPRWRRCTARSVDSDGDRR